MRRLSARWKLFLLASYLQFMVFGAILTLLNIFIFGVEGADTPKDMLYYVGFTAGLVLICLNNAFNIFAVHRYFPDSPVPQAFKVVMIITGILAVAVWIVMFILIIFMVKEIKEDSPRRLYYFSSLFSFIWISGVYTLIQQFTIFSYLKRNHENKISSLIDSIGSE